MTLKTQTSSRNAGADLHSTSTFLADGEWENIYIYEGNLSFVKPNYQMKDGTDCLPIFGAMFTMSWRTDGAYNVSNIRDWILTRRWDEIRRDRLSGSIRWWWIRPRQLYANRRLVKIILIRFFYGTVREHCMKSSRRLLKISRKLCGTVRGRAENIPYVKPSAPNSITLFSILERKKSKMQLNNWKLPR